MAYNTTELAKLFSDLKEVIQFSEQKMVPMHMSGGFFIGTQMNPMEKMEGFWFTMNGVMLRRITGYLQKGDLRPTNLEVVRFYCCRGDGAIHIVSC